MFISYDWNGYEEDTIGNRMLYIQKTSGNPYAVLQRYTDKVDTNSSLYGREIQKEVTALSKYIQDIEKEIKETRKRVDFYADGGKMSGQRETEMRTIMQKYFDMKMSAIKTKASLIREIDKSRKEDLKLQKDLTGNMPQGATIADEYMSDNSLMSNLLSGGVDNFFAATQYTPNPVPPTPQPIAAPAMQPQPAVAPQPVAVTTKTKESL